MNLAAGLPSANRRRRLEQTELNAVLKEHAQFLAQRGGKRADLRLCDLSDLDMADRDLTDADLSGSRLVRAQLAGARLNNGNLYSADMSDADLSGADLSHADLRGSKLHRALLSGATLIECDLRDGVLVMSGDDDGLAVLAVNDLPIACRHFNMQRGDEATAIVSTGRSLVTIGSQSCPRPGIRALVSLPIRMQSWMA